MFTVGLDVDIYKNLVSIVMVTLLTKIGLYAGKLIIKFGPLSVQLLGIIQTLKYYIVNFFKYSKNKNIKIKQSAGNLTKISFLNLNSNSISK